MCLVSKFIPDDPLRRRRSLVRDRRVACVDGNDGIYNPKTDVQKAKQGEYIKIKPSKSEVTLCNNEVAVQRAVEDQKRTAKNRRERRKKARTANKRCRRN
eukprot:Pgem_evm1s8890